MRVGLSFVVLGGLGTKHPPFTQEYWYVEVVVRSPLNDDIWHIKTIMIPDTSLSVDNTLSR
jgi:hypothetical protein